jgi:hypothetical protein
MLIIVFGRPAFLANLAKAFGLNIRDDVVRVLAHAISLLRLSAASPSEICPLTTTPLLTR